MSEEKVLINATICFPVKKDRVLLAMKMKKIGQGRWNGYGGGMEDGESPLQSIMRELAEEAGVTAGSSDLEKVAEIYFRNTKTDGTSFICKVHVYLLYHWQGRFSSTEEMSQPTWFKKNSMPLKSMMPADRIWLPTVLDGQKIIGQASYTPFQKELIGDVTVQIVKNFSD